MATDPGSRTYELLASDLVPVERLRLASEGFFAPSSCGVCRGHRGFQVQKWTNAIFGCLRIPLFCPAATVFRVSWAKCNLVAPINCGRFLGLIASGLDRFLQGKPRRHRMPALRWGFSPLP